MIARMARLRTVTPVLPARIARHDGLAYALWIPEKRPVRAGVVILHGAGSSKESHYDYARALLPAGFAAVAFDQRGHGESDDRLDGRALADVAGIARVLREACEDPALPLVLRGSSMGGFMALAAARAIGASAVVAICPAPAAGLRRGLRSPDRRFEADVEALDALLAEYDLYASVDELEIPVLLLHAEGDEIVPVEHSRELAAHLRNPASRLIAVPGGHHRSAQHDGELQAISIRFIERALAKT
jgi:alpha-beta hydrolase superfamily lysophospholipase